MTKEELISLNAATEFGNDLRYAANTLTDTMLREAFRRIKIIQRARELIDEVTVGDYVLIDGEYRMIASTVDGGSEKMIQPYTEGGHYCYVYNNGSASASGTLASPIKCSELVPTDEVKDGLAWSFLFGSGANKGVIFHMNFKVWKMI